MTPTNVDMVLDSAVCKILERITNLEAAQAKTQALVEKLARGFVLLVAIAPTKLSLEIEQLEELQQEVNKYLTESDRVQEGGAR